MRLHEDVRMRHVICVRAAARRTTRVQSQFGRPARAGRRVSTDESSAVCGAAHPLATPSTPRQSSRMRMRFMSMRFMPIPIGGFACATVPVGGLTRA
ncbi:hypothetical protein DO72_5914 [Burkholderia pseudomallei]|nr:hypothetical protein DP42_5708 [Burkholderia pseudomallei]KGD20700.1 hypothetical protein DO70_4992 [Burkholderia pseudomallei]KGD44335.1 hypothetical protein DO72_5914 [Burkholderia pseudomallei]